MSASTTPKHTSVADFVDPKVKTIAVTDSIIAAIMPSFPKSARVISGWLSEEDLYWKVNYHWDLLVETIDHCAALDIDQKYKDALAAIRKALWTNPPDPARGYRTSNIGQPKDLSTHETILKRHATLKQSKVDFKSVVEKSGLLSKTQRSAKAIALAYSPVAKPAQGKHSTGYALDIKGDNLEIKAIANKLGATMTFDEVSHVHCEWKNGVDGSGLNGTDSAAQSQRGVQMGIDNKITHHRHCLLRSA